MKNLSLSFFAIVLSVACYGQMPAPITGPSTVCAGYSIVLSDATPGGTWSSSISSVASIDPSGAVGGVAPGATIITYTTAGGSVDFYVSVSATPLPIAGPDHVCQGSVASPSLSEPVPLGAWSSSPAGIVGVFPLTSPMLGAAVIGITAGTAIITYTTPGCPPAFFLFTVNPKPAPITGLTAICSGVPTTLHDISVGGTWISTGISDSITVDSLTGIVRGTIPGRSGTIFYRLPTGCIQSTVVNVDVAAGPVTGPDSVCQGASVTLADTSAGGIWSSSSLAIGQVIDSSGIVYGVSAGAVNISYTLPTGCYATKVFAVSPLVPASVSVVQTPLTTLCAHDSITLTAIATNGGIAPTFVWDSFGVRKNTGSSVYGLHPVHSDVIFVTMITHGVCAAHDTVTDTIALNVYPLVAAPAITISPDPTMPLTATLGQVYTFFSSVVFGGTIQKYQWYLNGAVISGATNSSVSLPIYNTANIWCTVTGNAPCDNIMSDTSNHIIVSAPFVKVNSIAETHSDLSLFPNPNTGAFTLSGTVPATDKEISLQVCDMLGRVVYSATFAPQNGKADQKIAINEIAPGSYLLRVRTESGNEVFRFVISK